MTGTDPTLLAASSSSGSSHPPTAPTSPMRSQTSSPPTFPPSLSASNSGSRPPTAPTSPERQQVSPTSKQLAHQQQAMGFEAPRAESHGVVLGLQQLERQQAEQEQKRQLQAAPARHPALRQDSEDDDTAPSSTLNSNANDLLDMGLDGDERSSSIGRFIENTRKRMSSRDSPPQEPVIHQVYGDVPEEDVTQQYDGRRLLICGYLRKLGRNGKWQKRFFETDGMNLSYYKSSSRSKLLATLDLLKVGDIIVDKSDPSGCGFMIQVADRPYSLRADSKSSCKDWVITLNRVKEARMHLGRVQLVRPEFRADSDEVTARVVLVANRQRTTAVDGENIHSWEDIIAAENANKNPDEIIQSDLTKVADRLQHARVSSMRLQQAVVARWQKRQTSIQRLTSRLVRWAKSVNMKRLSSCTDVEDQVVLDPHVHPPGHDGHSWGHPSTEATASRPPVETVGSSESRGVATGHSAWIGKEANVSRGPALGVQGGRSRDDDDTREIS